MRNGHKRAYLTGDNMTHIFRDFPREVDMRKRKVVHSMEELQHYVKCTNGVDCLTTTVYGFRQLKTKGNRGEYNTAIIPHFVIDMDYERAMGGGITAKQAGERCFREVMMLHQHFLSNDWKHAMWFTGGGVHIWVNLNKSHELEPTEMANLLVSGRKMVDGWVDKWNLITLDPVVSFRPDRHIRIPNTYNFKRGLWGMPLTTQDLEGGWTNTIEKAMEPHGGMHTYGSRGMEIKIKRRDPNKAFEAEETHVDMKRINNINVLPCLASAACEKGSNPPHDARVMLMCFLQDRLRNFARPPQSSSVSNESIAETMVNFIEKLEWSDYDPETTANYVRHGVNRHYMAPSCRTLYEKGYCVGRCPFYDSSGGA